MNESHLSLILAELSIPQAVLLCVISRLYLSLQCKVQFQYKESISVCNNVESAQDVWKPSVQGKLWVRRILYYPSVHCLADAKSVLFPFYKGSFGAQAQFKHWADSVSLLAFISLPLSSPICVCIVETFYPCVVRIMKIVQMLTACI